MIRLTKKIKSKIIIISVIFFFIIILILLNNNFKIIEKITNGRLQNEDEETTEIPLITYQVYDNSDENKIKTLVTINDNNGIEYVEYPDGTKIETNNKTQFSVNYNMAKDENYTFKIKSKNNEEVQEKTVCSNDDFINNNGVSISKINNENGYKVIDIENEISLDGYKTYYQIGNNGSWVEGKGKIGLADYDLTTNNLLNEDNTITINAKIENQTTKNTVNMTKKYEVETSSQNNSYNSESLLKALENDEISTGTYKVTVEYEAYNLKVYSFDGNLTIKGNTVLGTEEDVATASEYAKNMVVLKVNGDLTVEEGATLTSYASKDGYGGTKGMTIYCTGTLNNNGTISMTARGAKAEGQDVYLWKNTDNSYEYVPAEGALGAKRVGGTNANCNGLDGDNGTNRQTGGGASGASAANSSLSSKATAYSGAGGQGTSYSGGTGGGGAIAGWQGPMIAKAGNSNGGSGGDSNAYYQNTAGSGAGNPFGKDYSAVSGLNNIKDFGTGGLLIINSKNLVNKGKIECNGKMGGDYSDSSIGGGASGGGSLNIFYKNNYENNGKITADGGEKTKKSLYNGGAGGIGSISIGQILDGTYKHTYINYQELEKIDWNEIAKAISNDTSITDDTETATVTIKGVQKTLNVGDKTTLDGKTVRILGFNHDELAEPTAYGTSTATGKAGISFEYVDFLISAQMNSSNTNSGGWNTSAIRGTLNGTTYNSLIIKNNIKKVKKDYIPTYNVASTQQTEDYLWLLSCGEIWDNGYSSNYKGYAITTEGKQYKYYKMNLGSTGYSSSNNITKKSNYWWLRSPYYNNINYFCNVDISGNCAYYYASESYGVAPGFSI